MKRAFIFILAAFALSGVFALPQLKSQSELVANAGLKIKVLANSQGVLPPTPQARVYTITRGTTTETKKVYDENELAYVAELLGMWKDKKGNVMRLAKVDKFPWGENVEYKTTRVIDGETYYVDFQFEEKVSPAQAEKLLKTAINSISKKTSGASAAYSSMKWWSEENEEYKFFTDLDRAKGGKFIKDTMRLMSAMRKSYEFYLPPTNKIEKCVVRVFSTLKNYREYRASTGVEDNFSCGLWDPSREELLIVAENPKDAHNTMRHEAFHQYLYFSTRSGFHAPWFNEGHACFFENVKFNPAKNTVKILDEGSRASFVSQSPARVASYFKTLLTLSHDEFYSADAHLNYSSAWALIYFLERGAYAAKEFEPYREIVPKYMQLTSSGLDSATATKEAFSLVANRDLEKDFLKFWNEKRKAALTAR